MVASPEGRRATCNRRLDKYRGKRIMSGLERSDKF
jgi:hypothetical protein